MAQQTKFQEFEKKASSLFKKIMRWTFRLLIMGIFSCLIFSYFDSLLPFLACTFAVWVASLFINAWIDQAAKRREEQLHALHKKLETMTEKHIRGAISEIRWEIKHAQPKEDKFEKEH